MAENETVIGIETRVSGEIRGDEDLVIKGRVDGKIHLSKVLTVEKGAIVQADVDVRNLVVLGTLVGNIVASESVRLLATARVVGDLASPRVMMESGAAYRGRVDMGNIEAAHAAVTAHSATKPASSTADASKARPAPPRVAPPPKTATLVKEAPKLVAPTPESRPAPAAASVPPAFPRVAGTASNAAPAWAKKKIRRR
jgi:cytoskeletal protein CcmA (bactofilin family)